MINSMQLAIIKKDLRFITANKSLLTGIIIVPLVFTIVLPVAFFLGIHFAPDEMKDLQVMLDMLPLSQQFETMQRTIIALMLNYILPNFFMIIPIIVATTMAASSFVGEKEKRTLETLLYCPLPLKQIFQSKVWASFFLSMAVTFVSFVVMLVVVQTGTLLTTGSMMLPGISWLVVMLLVSPAISLLAITLIVGGSAKAQTIEESYQRSVFLVIPLLLIIAGQFTGVILINAWYLLGAGAVLAVIAAIWLKRSMGKFIYEMLLK